MSPYNTPILPVKKPDGTYRMVQDLRIINEIVKARHPTVPDPYTILNQIPSSHQYYSEAQLAQILPLDFAVHNIQPGDWVLVKEWKEAPLVAKWRGPFQVLLTTETAIKTAEHGWTHHIWVKVSEAPEIWTSQLEEKDGKPRLTLRRSGLEQ
ncbi:hypothetical protein DUI87_19089 [Hirundo rustica rustica]|uniref:Murine leukemia virus integrase C-terminal domain-containing protein n=1 Tax=Hirundo rustica rustica TaxID=333673 RepID=A0A3M0JZF0_HIRRU|nr:hypothetical protein DUI87_19089 [Hirundo rustica rustica]